MSKLLEYKYNQPRENSNCTLDMEKELQQNFSTGAQLATSLKSNQMIQTSTEKATIIF